MEKNACFDSLATGLGDHISTQIIPNIVSVVVNELPIDITTTLVEASNTKLKIMSNIINIGNLADTAL